MKFFIDTADIREIRDAKDLGILDGVTTNPSLVAKTGRPFLDVVEEIVAEVPGPVSLEVVATDRAGIVREGRELVKIGENVVVKVPLIKDGLKAVRDLTEQVKGRYVWQLRFRFEGAAGLDELEFTTVTQVAQPMYPRLKPGGSTVVYRSAHRGVVEATPNLGLPETQLAQVEQRALRSANVAYHGRSGTSRLAYATRSTSGLL